MGILSTLARTGVSAALIAGSTAPNTDAMRPRKGNNAGRHHTKRGPGRIPFNRSPSVASRYVPPKSNEPYDTYASQDAHTRSRLGFKRLAVYR